MRFKFEEVNFKLLARILTVVAIVLYLFTWYYYLTNRAVIDPWIGQKITCTTPYILRALPREIINLMRIIQATATTALLALGMYALEYFKRLSKEESKN